MSNNLKPNNLTPFINKKVISSIPTSGFNLKDIIVTNSDQSKLLPLIPCIYFNNKDNSIPEDNIGSRIINASYNIDFNLKKLNIIKNFIISIIESSKYDLEKIKFSREKYKLYNENLFFNFSNNTTNSFKTQDDFDNFIDKYYNNKFNLLKKNNTTVDNFPDFLKIFQNEYQNNSYSKSYFMNLFKKYLEIRFNLIKYIKKDYGLLAFKFIFDLSNTQFFAKIKEIEKKKLKKEKNNNNKTIPYNNFILYDKNLGFNNIKDQLKVGDILTTTKSHVEGINVNNKTKIVIYKIDFRNSPDKPYTLQITDNANKVNYKDISIDEFNKYDLVKKDIISKNLVNKIHSFDLLYTTVANQEYYKDDHNKNIGIYYSNLNKSLDNYVGNGFSNNLYHILKSGFESDYNMLQFTFNYSDPILFSKIVDLQFMIKSFISNKINKFEQYYEAYLEWYEIFVGISSKLEFKFEATFDSDFKSFFDQLFAQSTGEKIVP